MWNSIRYHRENFIFGLVVIILAMGVVGWDWHRIVWDWLGDTNGRETNSVTVRNFGLIPLSVIAIYLTCKRIKIADRQAKTSHQNLSTARDALDLNYKTLSYTSQKDEADRLQIRYANASQSLSIDSVSARLSAIYELQVLTAHDPQQLHINTMKLLCAFVRFPPSEARFNEFPDHDPFDVGLRPDVQAAMEAIGSRTTERIKLETDAEYRPDLRGADLARLDLRNGNLSGIDIRGGRFWGASLTDSDLSRCLLQHADFSSPWALRGVELHELIAQSNGFFEAREAVQSNITYMTGVKLTGALMLSAKLAGTNLRGVDMSEANLPDVDLSEAVLTGVNFSESELAGANLSKASMSAAKLVGAKMSAVDLSGTDLTGSSTEKAPHNHPPTGLTQSQLDQARADSDNPPKLDENCGLIWNPD